MKTDCQFPGCDRPAKAHGLCSGHYQQQRVGTPLRPLRKITTSRPAHGCDCEPSPYCYSHHGCRCADCCAAHSRRHKAWRLRGPQCVDATGTIRRLRALCRLGWSRPEIGAMLGVNRSNVEAMLGCREVVTKRTKAAVERIYEALWQGPPEPTTTAERNRRSRARNAAIRHGWALPMQWDDDHGPHGIDNPEATPYPNTATARRSADVAAEVAELLGTDTPDNIAKRLGLTRNGLYLALKRSGNRELSEQLAAETAHNFAAMRPDLRGKPQQKRSVA